MCDGALRPEHAGRVVAATRDPDRTHHAGHPQQNGLVTFMHYDVGYFDDETCRLEPIENPFGPKVLPLRSE